MTATLPSHPGPHRPPAGTGPATDPQLAVTDPLTGLANQRGLLAAASGVLRHRHRPMLKLAVVHLDVDGLKEVTTPAAPTPRTP